jgi:predicted DNA-binding antitoxin AbrB/MazE fold protein
MNTTIRAIFENGVFRPVERVSLPDNTPVEIELRILNKQEPDRATMSEGLAKVYSILGERYNSGHTDTAARHNEHQP